MIKFSELSVFNIEGAIKGIRNAYNSWEKSDSVFSPTIYYIGAEDIKLAQSLIRAGSDERKFMRQIFISLDIEAPMYWWKEMDTYKIGTVRNSCSTMHKLSTTPITRESFSIDESYGEEYIDSIIEICESIRLKYLETKDKRYWRALIQLLPDSWMVKSTWTGNYEVLRNIYFARKHHKLSEWHEFCQMIENLPYGKLLICYEMEE